MSCKYERPSYLHRIGTDAIMKGGFTFSRDSLTPFYGFGGVMLLGGFG